MKRMGFIDRYQYYQFPTREGVALFYYGDLDDENLGKLAETKFLTEDRLEGEPLQWTRFAYGLVQESGTALYRSVNGDTGMDNAEPIAVLLTARSSILLVNFRYSSIDRRGTGQVLAAFEFSRELREYKAFYELRRNTALPRNTKKAFDASVPVIAAALKVYLTRTP
jgi:hypothetical protein